MLSKRLKSFQYAFNGLKVLIKEEPNARIHLLLTIIVISAGIFFNISVNEWIVVSFAIALVISMELLNSAIENISDLVSPEKNAFIKKAKDQGAAAVLISAIGAFIIGIIIFLPKVIGFIKDIS